MTISRSQLVDATVGRWYHGGRKKVAGQKKGVRNEWHLFHRKPHDSPGLYWSLGLVISVYDFGLRLTTRGSYLSGRFPTTCFKQQSSIVSQSLP